MSETGIRGEQIYNALWRTYPQFQNLSEEERWKYVQTVEDKIKASQPGELEALAGSSFGRELLKEGLTFVKDSVGNWLFKDTINNTIELVGGGSVNLGTGVASNLNYPQMANPGGVVMSDGSILQGAAPTPGWGGYIMPAASLVLGTYGAIKGGEAFKDSIEGKDTKGMLMSGAMTGSSVGGAIAGGAALYGMATAGAVTTGAASAAASSALSATAVGGLIGLAIGALTAVGVKNWGSKKSMDERLRQWSRDYLTRASGVVKQVEGVDGENHWIQLADGSLYNIGIDDKRGEFQDKNKGEQGKIQPFEMTDAELQRYGSRVDRVEAFLASQTEGLEDFSKQANRQLAQQIVIGAASQGDENLDLNINSFFAQGKGGREGALRGVENALRRGLITPVDANKYVQQINQQYNIMSGEAEAEALAPRGTEADIIDAEHSNRMRKNAGEYTLKTPGTYTYTDPNTGLSFEKTADGTYKPITSEEYRQGKRASRDGQEVSFYGQDEATKQMLASKPDSTFALNLQGIDYAYQTGQIDEKTAKYLYEESKRHLLKENGLGGGLGNLDTMSKQYAENTTLEAVAKIRENPGQAQEILESLDKGTRSRVGTYLLGLEARGINLNGDSFAPQTGGTTKTAPGTQSPSTGAQTQEGALAQAYSEYEAQMKGEQKRLRDDALKEQDKQRAWQHFVGGQQSPNMISQMVANRTPNSVSKRPKESLFNNDFKL